MSGWGCPKEHQGQCRKVPGKACDPGMKGCTLANRFRFATEEKNIARRIRDSDPEQETLKSDE